MKKSGKKGVEWPRDLSTVLGVKCSEGAVRAVRHCLSPKCDGAAGGALGVRSLGPWAVAQTPRPLSAAAAARCRQAYAQEKLTLLNRACEVDLRRRSASQGRSVAYCEGRVGCKVDVGSTFLIPYCLFLMWQAKSSFAYKQIRQYPQVGRHT